MDPPNDALSSRDAGGSLGERAAGGLVRHLGWVLASTLLVTAGLAVPFIAMPSARTASPEPPGEIFETRDLAAERFASSAARFVYVVEAKDGNILGKEALAALLRSQRALGADPTVGPKLLEGGVRSIANAVDGGLRGRGTPGLEAASKEQVNQAVAALLRGGPSRFALSVKATKDEATGVWSAPALILPVLADNEALGGGAMSSGLGAEDTSKERFARKILSILRDEGEQLGAWGLAVDVNLTSAEQGASAGPFIGATLFLVLLLVGLAFRSYWIVALIGFGLGLVIVWVKGASNLIALKNDQIISIIVPIAMISFGVDFAFHAIGRYREEQTGDRSPRRAMTIGLAGVLGALVVAAISDATAFLANTTTGIESLVQLGVAATIATVASFWVLGIAAPLALMGIETALVRPPPSGAGRLLGGVGAVLAAAWATGAVMVSVFASAALGVGMLGGYVLVMIALPMVVLLRRGADETGRDQPVAVPPQIPGVAILGRIASTMARHRYMLLGVVCVLTAISTYGATKIEARFDVRDFFSPDSDFVVGLEKFDTHVGAQSGEPALVYIEADLANPAVLRSIADFGAELRELECDCLARTPEGKTALEVGLLDGVRAALASPGFREALQRENGVSLTSPPGGLPEDRAQIGALFDRLLTHGVPSTTDGTSGFSAELARTSVWLGDGTKAATQIGLRLPGSRGQSTIDQARQLLEPRVASLADQLRAHDPSARAVFTGRPIARQASLDAILWAFRLSIPMALALCLLVAALFMRSFRYGLVSVIPVLLVTAWLYGFMYAFGYTANVVTATIGAISIGVGIDFSVHFTMRYREELPAHPDPFSALHAVGVGTGGAVAGSALSSIAGFLLLAFAPMPMFASYGLLTAIMISMALGASLVVLPALLVVVTPSQPVRGAGDSV